MTPNNDNVTPAHLEDIRAEQIGLRLDLTTRLNKLGDALTSARDDISVSMRASDAARRSNLATLAQLRQLIDTTTDDLRALNESISEIDRRLNRMEANMRARLETV